MNNKIKAIFFDIDGTIISFKTHKMPASTLEALHKLRDKDIKLFIATGRHKSLVYFLDDYFKFDAYITLNGQYCYNDKEIIYKNSIDKEDIKLLVKRLEKKDFSCLFVEEDYTYLNLIDDSVKKIAQMTNEPVPEVVDISRALDNNIYQLVVYLNEQKENMVLDYMKNSQATRWLPDFMDIIPKGGSKAVGIDAILSYYNISLEETMAFGDGQNDIEMLEHVAVGVAMGNADDIVKKSSDYITDDIDNDGLVKALYNFNIL